MDTTKLTLLFVQERLEKYYAGHTKLTDGIAEEIVNVFNRRHIGKKEFIESIGKYREAMSLSGKQSFTPDAWDLLKHTHQAKREYPVKIVMGIPNNDKTAAHFYSRCEMTKYSEYGMANYSGIEGGYTLAQWQMLLAKAKKDDAAKAKRSELTDADKIDVAKRKAYYAYILNKMVGREVIPVVGIPELPGPKPSRSLYEQKRQLAAGG